MCFTPIPSHENASLKWLLVIKEDSELSAATCTWGRCPMLLSLGKAVIARSVSDKAIPAENKNCFA